MGGPHAPRGFTPDHELLLHFVRGLAITARRRGWRHAAEGLPPPLGSEMMRQTGHAERWLLPSFRGDPFEACEPDWGVPLLA